jgi:hypothetical protein
LVREQKESKDVEAMIRVCHHTTARVLERKRSFFLGTILGWANYLCGTHGVATLRYSRFWVELRLILVTQLGTICKELL